ncbi:hypothetical protein NDU88_001846 [Pleurodeles waltl]|uniref:Uncharacterized protein n=1 Tax=Pleurodeles waltl TaxID=8319 RepID=A0AAV7NEK4_PLEWA|nr:hypothetical protein NDU88_001846 [Pleurodeles waltl]
MGVVGGSEEDPGLRDTGAVMVSLTAAGQLKTINAAMVLFRVLKKLDQLLQVKELLNWQRRESLSPRAEGAHPCFAADVCSE